MAHYDPRILQAYAEKLYVRASAVIACWFFVGMTAGFAGGFFLAPIITLVENYYVMLGCALLGGLIGYRIGASRAFGLKLKAQEAVPDAD